MTFASSDVSHSWLVHKQLTHFRFFFSETELPVPNFLHQKTLKLRTISKQLWDLSSVPRPRTFELLAINCRNELEKEKLLEFTQPQGQEDLYAYANRPRRTILEVLRDFPHSTGQLTLPILFELFQCIKTRSFSIASCHQSGRLDVLVAVVEYKTMLSTKRKGLCSNWLKSLSVGNTIRGVIKKGTFKFPKDDSTPLIMVGPGTGLAPFRSLLMEKRLRWDTSAEPMCTLFFGCRGEKLDFHCKWDDAKSDGYGVRISNCIFWPYFQRRFERDGIDKYVATDYCLLQRSSG